MLSAVAAAVGYRRASLNASGVIGAMITGTILFGIGGWEWGLLLLVFFFSSSFLSHYREKDKVGLAEKFSKGNRRDLAQALANAGVASVLALASLFWNRQVLYLGCVGAMAAVNADTWATELGVLSQRAPRLITNGRPVTVGTSGGITALGMAATLGGAGLIGLVAALAAAIGGQEAGIVVGAVVVALIGGLTGALLDSLLGATVQAIYWCDRCKKETEQQVHRCGTPTRKIRGRNWMNNDVVNFLASLLGALIALGIGANLG